MLFKLQEGEQEKEEMWVKRECFDDLRCLEMNDGGKLLPLADEKLLRVTKERKKKSVQLTMFGLLFAVCQLFADSLSRIMLIEIYATAAFP